MTRCKPLRKVVFKEPRGGDQNSRCMDACVAEPSGSFTQHRMQAGLLPMQHMA